MIVMGRFVSWTLKMEFASDLHFIFFVRKGPAALLLFPKTRDDLNFDKLSIINDQL